jgi:uroporphyrin-III C-methyltransferase/precorrin-2 dehydrogenase/sirohydrochlorin ferrochelatase
MKHFPIFVQLDGRRVVLSGGGDAAVAKLRLLMKTPATLLVFSPDPCAEIETWAREGLLHLARRRMDASDLHGATLVYAADEDEGLDQRSVALAQAAGILVNVVDNLEASAFITPAIVDRAPVTVAIGTEGTAPVLARALKDDLEARLPAALGLLARVGARFRAQASRLARGRSTRDFWSDYYLHSGPRYLAQATETGAEDAAQAALDTLFAHHLTKRPRDGHVAFIGAGPGDPDLLTLKARKALHEADVVIHDGLVSNDVLELCRREALIIPVGKQGYGVSVKQDDINAALVEHAAQGAQVARLKGGDPTVFGRLEEEIAALEPHGIGWHIIPGITAASASAAALGQSLTQRGRNADLRLLTAHDMQGFADHDWRALARPGSVAAIYMGKRAARFIQGRMLMHGAQPATPVSIVENASRSDQRILSTTLARLAQDLASADLAGPALLVLGLTPRGALAAPKMEAAQ